MIHAERSLGPTPLVSSHFQLCGIRLNDIFKHGIIVDKTKIFVVRLQHFSIHI